jgi:ankyrin repeat protein
MLSNIIFFNFFILLIFILINYNIDATNLLSITNEKDLINYIIHLSKNSKFFDVNNVNDNNSDTTLLMMSTRIGSINAVKSLLSYNADKDLRDGSGTTALLYAIKNLHSKVAIMLIISGANINLADKENLTPLMAACGRGLIDVVNSLLDHAVSTKVSDIEGWTALTYASNNGHPIIVKKLLKHGMDINARTSDMTALGHAAINNHSNVIKMIVDISNKTVDIDKPDREGNSPLMHLSSLCNIEGMRLLLKVGANANYENQKVFASTPLSKVAGENCASCMKLLINKGANVNHKLKTHGNFFYNNEILFFYFFKINIFRFDSFNDISKTWFL